MKTVLATLSIVVVLSAAAPSAYARAAQPKRGEGIVKTIRVLIGRLFGGGVTSNTGLPSTPIPRHENVVTPDDLEPMVLPSPSGN